LAAAISNTIRLLGDLVFLLGPTRAKPTQAFTETVDQQSLFKAINAQLKK
jgi:hypothetical protein